MAGLSLQRFRGGAVVTTPPTVGPQERVFVGDVEGTVRCLDPQHSNAVWEATPIGPLHAPVALRDGHLYVADTEGRVAALDSGGVVQWRVVQGGGAFGGIAVAPDGSVVFGTDEGRAVCLESDGRFRWSTPLGLPVRGHPAFDDDGNVVLPGLDLQLWSLHGSDGGVRWRRPLSNAAVGKPGIDESGRIVVATLGGDVHALSAVDGVPEWYRTLGAPIVGGVTRLGDGWVLATAMGQIVALDADGETLWQRTVGGAVRAAPAVGPAPVEGQPDWVFVVTSAGELAVFDATGTCQARWDVWAGQPEPDSRVLAGVAPGAHGVVVTAEVGHVLYAPWNAPAIAPEGWTVRPSELSVGLAAPERVPEGAPPLPFRASHLHVDQPPLVSALESTAGHTLDIGLLEHDDERGIALGLLHYAGGVERIAMRARREGLCWHFETERAVFPWLGMRVALSALRIEAGTHHGRFTMSARAVPSLPSWIPWRDHPSAAIERSGRPFLAARALWERLVARPPRLREVVEFGQGAVRTISALPRLSAEEVWSAWGLLDETREFSGRGHLAVGPMPPSDDLDVVVDHVLADATRRLVRASVGGGRDALLASPLSILLVDVREAPTPIALDYSGRTSMPMTDDGVPTHVELEIPLDTDLARPVEAWVLAGLRVVWRGPLTQRSA